MSKRILHLVAPFRCLFNLDTSLTSANKEAFQLWVQQLNNALTTGILHHQLPKNVQITCNQAPQNTQTTRYVNLNSSGNLYDSPNYFTLKITGNQTNIFNKAAQYADHNSTPLSPHISTIAESLTIDIYDNTISIATIDLTCDNEHNQWEDLDSWTTQFMQHLLEQLNVEIIHPFIDQIFTFSEQHHSPFLLVPHKFVIYHDIRTQQLHDQPPCQLLWVNRTLICPNALAIKGWTPMKLNDKEKIDHKNSALYLGWGNNMIITDNPESASLSAIWNGLNTAQYYYAVLDIISKNLSRFVGLTYHKQSNRGLRHLSNDMEAVVNTVTIFQIKYKDIYMELQGVPRTVFQRLEKAWDFDALFQNVQNKLNLCRNNITRLNECINQRNQTRVQLVLAVVAGLGIVHLMLNLATYRISYKNDDTPGLLDLIAPFQTDTLLSFGLLFAFGIGIFIMMNKPR